MNDEKKFFEQAQKIHDIHIRQEQSADMQIAEKRINQYFKGVLQLTWRSIVYEINKLPELDRNKYFMKLIDEQTKKNVNIAVMKERKDAIEKMVNWSVWTFLKQRRQAIENNYLETLEKQIKIMEGK